MKKFNLLTEDVGRKIDEMERVVQAKELKNRRACKGCTEGTWGTLFFKWMHHTQYLK